jgi:hypothetical protein
MLTALRLGITTISTSAIAADLYPKAQRRRG